MLDGQLSPVAVNSYVKLEYLGKKKGKGNEYHDFNVYVASEQAPAPAAAPAPTVEPQAATPAPVAEVQAEAPAPALAADPAAAPVVEEEGQDLPFW